MTDFLLVFAKRWYVCSSDISIQHTNWGSSFQTKPHQQKIKKNPFCKLSPPQREQNPLNSANCLFNTLKSTYRCAFSQLHTHRTVNPARWFGFHTQNAECRSYISSTESSCFLLKQLKGSTTFGHGRISSHTVSEHEARLCGELKYIPCNRNMPYQRCCHNQLNTLRNFMVREVCWIEPDGVLTLSQESLSQHYKHANRIFSKRLIINSDLISWKWWGLIVTRRAHQHGRCRLWFKDGLKLMATPSF